MKTIQELIKHLDYLEQEAIRRLKEIPEEFNDLQDCENYNYYSGVLEVVRNIKKFIGA